MNRKVLALSCLLIVAIPARAEDDGLLVVGGMDFAFKNVSLTVERGFGAMITTISPSVTVAGKRFYTTLAYDNTVAPGTAVFFQDGDLPGTLSLSRTDLQLTAGYRVTDSLGIFGGWLNGRAGAIISGSRETASGPPPEYNYFTQDIDYTTQGPFLGGSYNWPVGDKGSLNLSVAYAVLEGRLNELTNVVTQGISVNSSTRTVQGFSYGITWTGPLTESLSYRVGLKATRYGSDPTAVDPNGIIEQYTSFLFGISNYF